MNSLDAQKADTNTFEDNNKDNTTDSTNNTIDSKEDEIKNIIDNNDTTKYKFFTNDEMKIFMQEYKTIILYMDTGMPYINYDTAKTVFESVVGNNYSLEILSYEYVSEFETFMAHVRITLVRGDMKISKDVIGCERAKRKKDSDEIMNFDNLPKSAVKDAFKKFLSDYIGIGSKQYTVAKKEYEAAYSARRKGYQSSGNNQNTSDNQSYNCSDCSAVINQKVYNYSVNYHSEKRALCPNCQKKY